MFKHITWLSALSIALFTSPAFSQIPDDVEALIKAYDVAANLCFEQRIAVVKPACETRRDLAEKINRAGWCYRWPMKPETERKYVDCQTTAFENAYIDIDPKWDEPMISELITIWKLGLYDKGMTGVDPIDNKSIGTLKFTCNKRSGPRAEVLMNDSTSGVTGQPFVSEFSIGFKQVSAEAEISHPGSDFTKVVFAEENTLQLLNWVYDSIGASKRVDFKAREINTDRQIHFILSNLTTKNRYSSEVKNRLEWADAMRNKCAAVRAALDR